MHHQSGVRCEIEAEFVVGSVVRVACRSVFSSAYSRYLYFAIYLSPIHLAPKSKALFKQSICHLYMANYPLFKGKSAKNARFYVIKHVFQETIPIFAALIKQRQKDVELAFRKAESQKTKRL